MRKGLVIALGALVFAAPAAARPGLTFKRGQAAIRAYDSPDHAKITFSRCFRRDARSVQCWEKEQHVYMCNIGYAGCYYGDLKQWARATLRKHGHVAIWHSLTVGR